MLKRIILLLSVALVMVAMMVASAMPAFAAPQDASGTCNLGGHSDNGAEGCAGNIGGTVENNQTEECKETNQGPFADRKEFRCKGNSNK